MTDRSASRRIVLFGLFGQGNLGNDATLVVTLQELRRRLGQVEVLCVCSALPPSAQTLDVQQIPLDPLPPKGVWRIRNRQLRYAYCAVAYLVTEPWRRRRMLRHLQGTDEFIVVGTGVLDDFGMLPWDLPAWLLRWTHYSRNVGADVKFLSVGAGPIRNRLNRYLMLKAARTADLRTYRDTVSRDFLADHGIDTEGDLIAPDVVFGISTEYLPGPGASTGDLTTVGVGVMGYYGWRNDQALGESIYQEYVRKMALFVNWLIEQEYAVQLLIGELPADQRAVQDITSAVSRIRGAAPARLTAPAIGSLDDLLEAISHCGNIVASRYHNVICALRLGKPVIALGYAAKFDALMQDVGLAPYCRSIETFDPEELKTLFVRMKDSNVELVELVRQNTEKYRLEVNAVFDLTLGTDSVGRRL